jgi:cell shape-determining protein MreC
LVSNIINWFSSKRSIITERDALQEKVAVLELISIERDVLLAENKELKDVTLADDGIIAEVLLHPGFSPFDIIFLSKGLEDGIGLGDLVLYHSLVIGEISEISANTATAELFSTPGKTFPVRIGKAGIETEAQGLGGGTFASLLPKNVEIENGEPVLLSASKPRIFGKISEIESEEHDAFKRVLFSLPININSIKIVTVEKKEL